MSFFKNRAHRKSVRALFQGNKQATLSTDDILSQREVAAAENFRGLQRQNSDPISRLARNKSTLTLRSTYSASTSPQLETAMAAQATITFSQPGVQAPVYVVTSLSTPPWEILEMQVSEEKTGNGDLIFVRHFDNVADGDYQYKVRIGEGHWVVDESTDADTDDVGNRNNVISVKTPEPEPLSLLPPTPAISDGTKALRQDSVHDPALVLNTQPEDVESPPTASGKDADDKGNDVMIPVILLPSTVGKDVHYEEPPPYDAEAAKQGSQADATTLSPVPIIVVEDDAQAPLFRHESFDERDIQDAAGLSNSAVLSDDEEPFLPQSPGGDKRLGRIFEEEEELDLSEAPLLPHEQSSLDSRRELTLSDTPSAPKHDGANDNTKRWGGVYENVDSPASVRELPTPPMTPEKSVAASSSEDPVSSSAVKKHASKPSTDSMAITPAPLRPREREPDDGHRIHWPDEIEVRPYSAPSDADSTAPPKKGWIRSFIGAFITPVGKFLAACFGGREYASGGALLVLGVAVAIYYFIGFEARAG
ncbi:hypothetical protein BCR34DRAFT_601038 [Clohesyomyces aquaticus]|uniref:AMP-activated protein kinase glycogen-binding domain-containing protein n=1 Tax=Clohesyomyces aquaticus TaxID=1231657 RepID=A0A1Y1ZNU6_9PLEO|nr:hypothetical protein BCR34DRAFT_601038 [Clohesyomyces aquaticus]